MQETVSVADEYVLATGARASGTSFSNAIGMAFDLRTCKSERLHR